MRRGREALARAGPASHFASAWREEAALTTTAAPQAPPDRGMRYFAAQQTTWSWLALGVGVLALLALFIGTGAILTAHGWTQECPEGVEAAVCTPTAPLVEGLTSSDLGALIYTVIGIQAAVLAGVLLWFRGSNVEVFARNFLNIRLLGEFFPRFVNGAKNTLILSLLGGGLGMFLGLILALFTMSKRAVVRAPARLYINFFRGTPLIWQLSFAGLGVVTALRLDFFSGTSGPYRVAIAVLGLNLAAYSAEVYRAGIQSLERGQIEAARSLGLSYFQAMRFVIVPQAIRRVIPPLTNEFVILIKDTSLVIVLGLAFFQKELLGVGRDIYNSSFNATAWLGSAAGYLIITLPMIRLVTYLERRMRSGLTSVVG